MSKYSYYGPDHAAQLIRARGGYYRVQEGIRAAVWGFSVPTAN